MIKLPEYQPRGQTAALPTPNVSARLSPDQIDGGMGNALGQIGQQFADIAIKERDAADTTAVLEADRKLSQWQVGALYGENGALNRKGKDTLGLPDETSKAFDSYYSEVAAGLTSDKQRMALSKLSADRRESLMRTLYQHSSSEMERHYDGEFKASIDTARSAAALAYGDSKKVDEELQRGAKIIAANAVRKGLGEEARAAAMRSWTSTVHTDVATRMLEQDPLKAQQYVQQNADKYEAQDLLSLYAKLDPAVTRIKGMQAGDAIFNGAPAAAPGGNVLFSAMINQESGGQQLGKNGAPLTSPKGAVGIAQLMPDTAKEAAKLAGLPWDEARYKTDAEYNQRLGAAYFGRLQRDFGGNPVLSVAAYNAGPGMVEDWVNGTNKTGKNPGGLKIGDPRKGEISSEEFARRIPFGETRNYVAKVMATAGGAGGDRSLSSMLAATDRIADPEQRRIAQAQVRQRFEQDKLVREERYMKDYTAAQDVAFSKPGGWRDIPPTVWAAIKPEDRARLVQGAPKASDPDTLLLLQNNPSLWQTGQIERYRPLLTESDYQKFFTDGNGPGAQDKIRDASIDLDMFNNALENAGLGDWLNNGKNLKAEDKQARMDLRAKFKLAIEAEQTNKKRALTLDEKNALLAQLIKPVKVRMVRSGTLFGLGDGEATPEERRAFQVKNPRNIIIPPDTRAKISADMKARGITPTNDRVLSAYLAMNEGQ